jgi:hypothetical protein
MTLEIADPTKTRQTKRTRQTSAWWAARSVAIGVRLFRLATFCTGVITALLVVGASRARGDVGEKMIALGRELMPLADLIKGAQRATVNGQTLYIATAMTDESLPQVLDRYEAHCREHTGGFAEEFAAVPQRVQDEMAKRAPAAWSQRLGIVREQKDGEGMVVCIAQPDDDGIRGFARRVTQFLDDGELSHLGNMRYAYVQKMETGRTHVLTTFTEGSFNIYRVVGTDDVHPREELAGVPLPANATTPMTFRMEGMPYAVQSFATPETPDQVAAYYLRELPLRGWERVAGPGDLFGNLVMRRNGVTLLVTALQIEEGGQSHVAVTEGAPVDAQAALR